MISVDEIEFQIFRFKFYYRYYRKYGYKNTIEFWHNRPNEYNDNYQNKKFWR